jgi:outer membrane protein OmpA-like peptidoglycan-associated protein
MMRRYALALLATVAASAEAYGQQAGTFELGLFGNVSYFDKSLDFDQGQAGPGARLGYHFSDHLAVEAEGAWVPVVRDSDAVDVSYLPIRGRLAYNFSTGEHSSMSLGAGYVHNEYGRDVDESDDGGTGSIGLRLGTGETVSFRIDAYLDYIPSPANLADDNWNWGVQPGLSFMFGGQRGVRDRDADGVPDKLDKCAKTPTGDKVDATGCTIKDSDNDGVLDDVDACADTPAGDRVDEKGCSLPKDADGDGVTDDKDACANTPAGDKVDEKGCSLPKDADGDGVTDDKDECANTPAGQKVNEKGCPADTDGDGVTDEADRCPSTPAGVKVDAEGCQVLFEEAKKTVILEGVNFETGKADLTPESQAILDGVAESLVANEEIKVQVGGHTDNTGSRAVNQRLSRARAETVRKYLVDKGVAADRLTARGFGPDKPVASNRTQDGRAQNRRVELTRTN